MLLCFLATTDDPSWRVTPLDDQDEHDWPPVGGIFDIPSGFSKASEQQHQKETISDGLVFGVIHHIVPRNRLSRASAESLSRFKRHVQLSLNDLWSRAMLIMLWLP
jgi:hypothetical protein